MRHRKVIPICLCTAALLVCLGAIILCFYSCIINPTSPFRDSTTTFIPNISVGEIKLTICSGIPAFFAGLTASALKALWKRPA